MVSKITLARRRQAEQLKIFRSDRNADLYLGVIAKFSDNIYSKTKAHHYHKDEILIANAGAIHFIKKDNETESFVWHAPVAAIEKALYYGLIPVESPTAKAISALGIYRQQVLTRAYKKGIISNKHAQKEALITIAQDNITALQGLELLVNTFHESADLKLEKIRLIKTITIVLEQLKSQKNNVHHALRSLAPYDKNASQKMADCYAQQIHLLTKLIQKIDKADRSQIKDMLKATGIHAIMTDVKIMSMATLVKIQELNQNITYSRRAKSLLRGDLNSACEDALKAIRDYEADPHSPILPEHQGHFSPGLETSATANEKTIAIDFNHLGKNEEKIRTTFRAIVAISGAGIQSSESSANIYTLNDEALHTTAFTKWKRNDRLKSYLKRMFYGIYNIIMGLLVGIVFDLPIGFLTSFLSLGRYKMTSLTSQLTKTAPSTSSYNLVSVLMNRFSFKSYSAGVVIGHMLGSFIGDTVLDIITGVWQAARNFRFKGFDEIRSDFKTGAWRANTNFVDKEIRLKSKLKLLAEIKAECEQQLAEKEAIITREYQDTACQSAPLTYSSSQSAIAPYHLSTGEWDDISNAFINGLITVQETFTHNIHAKHQFAGLIFSGTYVLGGLSILAPNLVSFLSGQYIAFSKILGDILATGPSAAAIASGFTQAKLFTAIMEAAIHGGDSWLAMAIRQFEKNAANTIVYSALAMGLGYNLANYIQIPGLSNYLRDDAGDVPQIGWTFAGGKIGLLLLELLKPQAEQNKPGENLILSQINAELRIILPTASEEQLVKVREKLFEHMQQLVIEIEAPFALEFERLKFIDLLQKNEEYLSALDNKSKRDILFIARYLFKNLENQGVIIRSLRETLYPQVGKSIFTRTITLIMDYVPLMTRCLLSPISTSKQPWIDLKDKLIKDTTRIFHGLSKLTNNVIKTIIRLVFRGVLDVITNEIGARMEGFLRNDKHAFSAQTYQGTTSYEKGMEIMRQFSSKGVDIMRSAATAPAIEVVFNKTQQSALTALHAKGFFNRHDIPENTVDQPENHMSLR
jgi:hypothetical protein